MAKKLTKEEAVQLIEESNTGFSNYLRVKIPKEVWLLLVKLATLTDVYVFSGVIRNYFINNEEIRDLDIVLRHDVNIEKIFSGYIVRRNNYKGFKISHPNLNIDIWFLHDTWTIKFQGMFDFFLPEYISRTALFNFSAIVYSLNQNKFYYTPDFINFLIDRKINVVNKLNPNYPLTIVNTFYYADKYGFAIDKELIRYIVDIHKANTDYSQIQLKHFGRILYSNHTIERKIKDLWLKY